MADEMQPGAPRVGDEGADIEIDVASEEVDETIVDEHFANLAESIDPDRLNKVATTLLDLIEKDMDARSDRDERYAEALRLTGLSAQEDVAGADFEGASNVIHPILNKAVIDFQSSTVKELFPPGGPVKDKIIGSPTQEKVDKARRKAKWLNYQATEEMREFRPDFEEVLSQCGLAGAAYLKFYWDKRLDRPKCEPVFRDKVIYPSSASSFDAAPRKAHMMTLSAHVMDERIKSGMYSDVGMSLISVDDPAETAAGEVTKRIAGVVDSPDNADGVRTVYEVYAYLDLETDGEMDPYVVTIDETSRKVLAVYRNWEPDDPRKIEMDHIVEFSFIPWRGGSVGFVEIIGSLAKAGTGALNALLDSAHVNNMPTGLRLKGVNAQDLSPSPGEILEVDGGAVSDDIRKLYMPLPFNPPSAVLFQLLGFVTQAAEGAVQTTMEKLADQRQDAPVGTTMALIEQGMKVFSAIHARLHWSMGRALRIIHRLNKHYLSTQDVQDATGEIIASRSDFMGPCNVVPVSDPAIFSEAQRLVQIQALMQRADAKPQIYNQREVEAEFLDRIRMGDHKERFLNPIPAPQNMNAVNENVAATLGRPIGALPEQDHMAHIIAHMEYLRSPLFGMNPLIGQKAAPILLNHIREHVALYYLQRNYNAIAAVTNVPPESLFDTKDEQVTQAFDKLAASVSSQVVSGAQSDLEQFMPDIQKAQQFAQSFQPASGANPMEIEAKKVSVAEAQVQQDGQSKMLMAQARQKEADARLAESQRRAAVDERRIAQESAESEADRRSREGIAGMQMEVRREMNESDNQTALTLADMEIASGERIQVSTGTGINP
jgi:hypothetical protein